MSELPSGTVTFLFTDIEGSTKFAQEYPDAVPALLARHHAIMQSAVTAHNGYVFQIIGDAFCAAFHTAPDALHAAVDAQRTLQHETRAPVAVKVRMGINTGIAQFQTTDTVAGGYAGYSAMARVQRVMSTAYGEQILLSNTSAELVRGELTPGISLRDMGEHRLKGLLNPERLWQVVAPGLHQDFPPLQTLNAVPNNLPIQVTSFIGREQEIAQAKQILLKTRLLTLTGSGGAGKTRLSLEIAAGVLDAFQDGVWFVELAPLGNPALVANSVAAALGLREEQGRSLLESIADFFRSKHALLILDNCEHLIEACAEFADALLHSSRETRILATSREALGIAGETAYRVPSLEMPNPREHLTITQLEHYAAVRLFIERATQALTTFTVTNENAPAVAQICFRLDGIPLAIELAAARVKSLPVEKIAGRLDDRFRLLTGGSRTALPRQQTLYSMIDWSHSLLSEPERALLRRLSVFAGGWTLEAAEEVCAGENIESVDVVDLLTRLVDKSLVVMEDNRGGGRYHFLETIRQYAREKLFAAGEGEQIRERHLDYFLRFAVQAEPMLHGPEQYEWMDLLDHEHDNLRAALEWSNGEERVKRGLKLVGALKWFWDMRAYWREGREYSERLLGQPGVPANSMERAIGLSVASRMSSWLGEYRLGNQQLTELISIAREHGDTGLPLLGLGIGLLGDGIFDSDPSAGAAMLDEGITIARKLGDEWILGLLLNYRGQRSRDINDNQAALQALEESLARFNSVGDKYWTAVVAFQIGTCYFRQGEYVRARQRYQETLTFFLQTKDLLRASFALNELGEIARGDGNYDLAKRYYTQSLEISRELGIKYQIVGMLGNLGFVALHDGQIESAGRLFTDSLALAQEIEHVRGLPFGIMTFASLAAVKKQPQQAIRLFATTNKLLEGALMPAFAHPDKAEYERYLALAREQLTEAEFNAAWQEGQALTIDQAIELALRV